MPIVGASLGDDVDDPGGGAAKFGGIIRIDNAKFLNRFLRWCPALDPRSRGNIVGAIYGDEVVMDVLPREGKLRYRFDDHIRIPGRGIANRHSRGEERKVNEFAAS